MDIYIYNSQISQIESFPHNFNSAALNNKKIISFFNQKLFAANCVNANGNRELWEKDIGVEFDAEILSEAFESAKKLFTCNRLRESQYRILQRLQ